MGSPPLREWMDSISFPISLAFPIWMSIILHMEKELLIEIDRVAWMDASNEEIVNSIRGLLYQYGACQDAKTEQLFGDDDAHISKRKF